MINQKGQTLVTIVFLMVIALSIGIYITSRYIGGLANLSKTDSSSRVLAAAEAGIEKILLSTNEQLIGFITNNNCGSLCNFSIGDVDVVLTLSRVSQGSNVISENISTSEVHEINLTGYPSSRPIKVCWDEFEMSVYASYVYGDVGSYLQDTFAFNSYSSTLTNGFSQATSNSGFANCFSFTTVANSKILRIRPINTGGIVNVLADTGLTFASQGIKINSKATFGQITKTVSVVVSENSMPVDFDFVILQNSSELPLSN